MAMDFSNIKDAPSISIRWEEVYARKALQILFHYAPSSDLFRAILNVEEKSGYRVHRSRMLRGEIGVECPSTVQIQDVAKEFARSMEQDFGRVSDISQGRFSPLPSNDEDKAYANSQGGFILDFEAGSVERVEVDQEATDAAIRRRLFGKDPLKGQYS